MSSLDTAEAVTRHLRSKNLSASDAEATAYKLWRDELPVHLPNKAQFLFELLCDRMGDFGQGTFAQWKKSSGLWRLWRSIYEKLSEKDVETRNTIFSRVKLLQVISAILDERVQKVVGGAGDGGFNRAIDQGSQPHLRKGENPEDGNGQGSKSAKSIKKKGKRQKLSVEPNGEIVGEETVVEMFACVQDITTYGYVDVDEYIAVGLLGSYCRYIKTFGVGDLQWTKTIQTLYELPHQYILYKPGKQSLNRYFSQVVPVQLSLFVENASEKGDEWVQSVSVMHSMFCTFLFKYTSSSGLVQHVTQLIEDQRKLGKSRLPDSCISHLFHEIISNLAVSEIHTCEAVYKALVQPPYAHLAEDLVTVLAKVNRTLSPDFYTNIHAEAMDCVHVNWTLVSHIMKLHPTLHTGWKPVVDGTSSLNGEPLSQIAKNLVASFAGARELGLFMSQVYPYAAQYAGWTDSGLMDEMAQQLTDLSANRLLSLANEYLQKESIKPMSLLVRVLARSPAHKQKSLHPFFKDVSNFPREGWAEVLYQVVSLYPETEGVAETNVQSQSSSKYDVFLVFRLGELQKQNQSLEALFKDQISHLDADSLAFFLQRWLVLLDQKCPEVYPELFRQIFQKWDKSRIMEFFETHKMHVCEMKGFLGGLSTYMQEHRPIILHDILKVLPTIVFRKFFLSFLEILIADAMDQKSPENSLLARSTLNHLLSKPTLQCTIEKSFDKLYEYVVSANQDALNVTLETAQNIWTFHLRSIKSRKSGEFVDDCMQEMKKIIKDFKKAQKESFNSEKKENKEKKGKHKKKGDKLINVAMNDGSHIKLSSQVLLTHRFLSIQTDKVNLKEMTSKFVSMICSLMNEQNFEEMCAILDTLPYISGSEAEISGILGKFGAFSMSEKTKAMMFSLMSKISTENQCMYVLALFLVLRSQTHAYRTELQNALLAYLRQLSEISIEKCFGACFDALNSWDDFFSANFDLLATLTSALPNEKMHTGLVTKALHVFLLHCHRMDQEITLHFVEMLTDMVSSKGGMINTYVVEMLMATAYKVTSVQGLSEQVYVATTKLVLYVVNAHRSKFVGRYHVVTKLMSGLMVPLTERADIFTQKGKSVECAASFARLLTTLCEPPVQASNHSDSLTSRAAVYRAALRKHAHVILANYIQVRLEMKFSSEINDALMPGVFSLMELFSKSEHHLVSSCLDSSGRTYFQTLYALYRDHGKWKE